MKPKLFAAVLSAALLLGACGTPPTPAAEADTGVDKYGPYTVVARGGDAPLQTLASNTTGRRTIELRRYGPFDYSATLIIKESDHQMHYMGNVAISFRDYPGNIVSRGFYDHNQFSKTAGTMYLFSPRRAFRGGYEVCAVADGNYRAYRNQGSDFEMNDMIFRICRRAY